MGFGALRGIIRPVSRALTSITSSSSATSFIAPKLDLQLPLRRLSPWTQFSNNFSFLSEPNPLTDSRFPKRRPMDKSRRKRAALKPPGPYAWVQYVPGEPIKANNPNEGSFKRRNEKKRIRQRRAFILSEKKKRQALIQEAKRKKNIQKVDRKMAAVARDREWTQRLAELQRLEEEKKNSMA